MAKKEIEETELQGDAKFDVIDGFVLENADKLERVIHGDVKRAGVPEGGLGEDADPKLVLAHYDRLAGYITKSTGGAQRVKIKTGSFWDFKNKRPHAEPKIMYIFRVAGENIEVNDPANLAAAVTTIQSAVDEKSTKNEERRARAKRKSLIKGE